MPLDFNDPAIVDLRTRIASTAQATTDNVNTHINAVRDLVNALAAQVKTLQATVASLQAPSGGTAPTAFTGTVELTAK